jgi:glutaminase
VLARDVQKRVDRRLQELYERHRDVDLCDVATFYEPGRGYCGFDLTTATHDQFAIALVTTDGDLQSVGDDDLPFALQSVSKVFVYGLALEDHGREHVLRRVGVERSGDAFNSIVFDERHNRPYNPMVNAGALVTSDLVRGADSAEKLERLLGSLRHYAGNDSLEVDARTLKRELQVTSKRRLRCT